MSYNAYVLREFSDTDLKHWLPQYDEYLDTLEEAKATVAEFERDIRKYVELGYIRPGLYIGRIKDAEGWVIEKRWEI